MVCMHKVLKIPTWPHEMKLEVHLINLHQIQASPILAANYWIKSSCKIQISLWWWKNRTISHWKTEPKFVCISHQSWKLILRVLKNGFIFGSQLIFFVERHSFFSSFFSLRFCQLDFGDACWYKYIYVKLVVAVLFIFGIFDPILCLKKHFEF